MTDLVLDRKPPPKIKFLVVGIIPSVAFQKCRYITEKLHSCFPDKFAAPEIRPMLNVAWDEYLTKMRRRHGKKYYLLFEPVVVHMDGQFLGDDKALFQLVRKDYVFEVNVDFEKIANESLSRYLEETTEKKKRKFVYMTIVVDDRVIGSLLFLLYNDLVPQTCENFMCFCENKETGYQGTRIHRIAKSSFIQCGGFNLNGPKMACENYAVSHDRRGVLSMCNEKRHVDNSTQFFVTLEPAKWLDYKYVAFGQLIQGAEVLAAIERVATYYQNPLKKIFILRCGEFTACPKPEDEVYMRCLNPLEMGTFLKDISELIRGPDLDTLSVVDLSAFKDNKYFLPTDLVQYSPFQRLSTMFLEYLRRLERLDVAVPESQEPPVNFPGIHQMRQKNMNGGSIDGNVGNTSTV